MINMAERVRHLFGLSIEAKISMADTMSDVIAQAADRLVNCLLADGRILICGDGPSRANCMHFSAAMFNQFDVERPPLPVISLATDGMVLSAQASDGGHGQVFARQIQALGREKDLLLALTTSGNSDNVLHAVNAAHEQGMDTIALCGRDGGVLANHLGPEDIELRVSGDSASRIREAHLFILHCFCDLIDLSLFGQVAAVE